MNNLIEKFCASFFSALVHPLFMLPYGILLMMQFTFMAMLDIRTKLIFAAVLLGYTIAIPILMFLMMRLFHLIQTLSIRERKERIFPFITVILSYVALAATIHRMHVPVFVIHYVFGAMLALVVVTIITFKWKISAHMTGIGGLLGGVISVSVLMHLMPLSLIVSIIILAGFLASSRIVLQAHTPAQVYAGFVVGLLCVGASPLFSMISF